MSKLFLHLLNISITAGWIVLVVVLLRFVLKKAPKWIRVVLWGLVALRLMLPVSIESVTSLVPSAETVKVESVTAPVLTSVNEYNGVSYFYENVRGEQIVLQSGFSALNSAVNPTPAKAAEHFDTVAVLKSVAGWVWLAGVCGMLLYALISFLRLRHRVRASVLLEKGVYVCDEISDPFILGLIVPKIYLPSGMDEQTRAYVLAHERAHLKRFDYIWKPLGFLLLSIYWFNPLLWLAYLLLCRDIELACDEKVVKELDDAGKAAYSEALVTASVSRHTVSACPLAFGETGVKSRVKSVLNYKKPAFWIILVAILACVAVAVCFLTMPKKKDKPNEDAALPTAVPETVWGSDAKVVEWLDYFYSSDMPWNDQKEITLDAFPGATFRWKDENWGDSILAEENGKTRKLFSGMPVRNVFFADVTGDGKPELCASVYFGSGIVDEHIVVYDYVNKQSYVLWDRGTFDYHLSLDDGALQVIKRIFNTSILPTDNGAFGELVMEDGLLCCHWRNDGSYTALLPELHESELTGEWLVDEEKDNDGNVLYTFAFEDLWKEYRFEPDGTVVYNETVPISSDYEKAFGHPVEYAYEVYDDHVFIKGERSINGYLDPLTGNLKLNYQPSPGQYVYQTLRRMDAEAPVAERTCVGEWELYQIAEGTHTYGQDFIAALSMNQTLTLNADGSGVLKSTEERSLTYTANGNNLSLQVSYTIGNTERNITQDAVYDPQSDTLTIGSSYESYIYVRAGKASASVSSLTLDHLVGVWKTSEDDEISAFVSAVLVVNHDGAGTLTLKSTYSDSETERSIPLILDGNIIRIAPEGDVGTIMVYDPTTDQIAFPIMNIGILNFVRTNAPLPAEANANASLTQEQADAFVNGLSVEFEDGSPYGCDLVVFIDGFGTCLNVGDPNAFERASLRYELLSRNNQNGSIDYAKILSVGELPYYIGDITVFAYGDQLVYGEEWNDEYPFADASILVPVNPLMMDRNQSCPERCCVIRSFDPVNRTVTVSFGLQEEMSSDAPGEYVDYASIETEQITLQVTDETFLTLIGDDYDTLVKPDRFFRFFEEYEFIDLYLFDENNEDVSIGFWIGVDGDTLLYLCEMMEV